jgi:flagellar protein FliJ
MKSFKFRFTTLLRTKKLYVDEALQVMETARQNLDNLKEKLKGIVLELDDLKVKIHKIQSSLRTLHELEESQYYFNTLHSQLALVQDDILLAENIYAQKKNLLQNALKEKKIIEKLKEKQYKVWNQEVKKQEGKQVDEAAVIQFLHNSRAKKHE